MNQTIMMMYYNHMDHDWTLYNLNYHQMIQIIIQLAKNLSYLRIDSPECYFGGVAQKVEDYVYEKDLEVDNSEEYKILKKICKMENVIRNNDNVN